MFFCLFVSDPATRSGFFLGRELGCERSEKQHQCAGGLRTRWRARPTILFGNFLLRGGKCTRRWSGYYHSFCLFVFELDWELWILTLTNSCNIFFLTFSQLRLSFCCCWTVEPAFDLNDLELFHPWMYSNLSGPIKFFFLSFPYCVS